MLEEGRDKRMEKAGIKKSHPDRENIGLEETARKISLIRGVGMEKVKTAGYFLKMSDESVLHILDLIQKNPGMDDFDIARVFLEES